MNSEGSSRHIGLDMLRFAAIVLVILRHSGVPQIEWSFEPLRGIVAALNRGGWIGVDLFFVLSGFLVSGLLFTEYQRTGRLSLQRFFIRRGWKIYPPFYLLIAITLLRQSILGSVPAGKRVASELLFVQSYNSGLWPYTWSVAVEEHFYVLLPLLLLLLVTLNRKSDPFRYIVIAGVTMMVLMLAMRTIHAQFNPRYTHLTHMFATHLRMDSLFCGVLISYAWHFHRTALLSFASPLRRVLVPLGIACLVPAFLYPPETPFIYTVGFTLFYVGSGLILIGALVNRTPTNRMTLSLAGLGAASYSTYLWHGPVLVWGLPLVERLAGGPLSYGSKVVYFLSVSLFVGWLMARLVETPMLRLRNAWFPSRTDGPARAPTHTVIEREPRIAIMAA